MESEIVKSLPVFGRIIGALHYTAIPIQQCGRPTQLRPARSAVAERVWAGRHFFFRNGYPTAPTVSAHSPFIGVRFGVKVEGFLDEIRSKMDLKFWVFFVKNLENSHEGGLGFSRFVKKMSITIVFSSKFWYIIIGDLRKKTTFFISGRVP